MFYAVIIDDEWVSTFDKWEDTIKEYERVKAYTDYVVIVNL